MRDHVVGMLEHGAGMKKGLRSKTLSCFAVVGRMSASIPRRVGRPRERRAAAAVFGQAALDSIW